MNMFELPIDDQNSEVLDNTESHALSLLKNIRNEESELQPSLPLQESHIRGDDSFIRKLFNSYRLDLEAKDESLDECPNKSSSDESNLKLDFDDKKFVDAVAIDEEIESVSSIRPIPIS